MQHRIFAFLRTTLVGGLVFLLPVVLLAWLGQKAMQVAVALSKPALRLLPPALAGDVVIGAVAAALALVFLAFFAGLVARTGPGQRLMAWVENSLIGSLPQFNFVRGIADSIDSSEHQHVEVVLVPADAGWALGFVFEPGTGDTVAVFLPGAPQWTSGSVVFAERSAIRPAGIGFTQAIAILRKLGVGSSDVAAALAKA